MLDESRPRRRGEGRWRSGAEALGGRTRATGAKDEGRKSGGGGFVHAGWVDAEGEGSGGSCSSKGGRLGRHPDSFACRKQSGQSEQESELVGAATHTKDKRMQSRSARSGLHGLLCRRVRVLCHSSIPVRSQPSERALLGSRSMGAHLTGLVLVGLTASGWTPFVGGLAWGMFSGEGMAVPTLCGAVLPALDRA